MKYLFYLLSVLYPYDLCRFIRKNRDVLYTMWIRNFFRSFGRKSKISYPCFLQGKGYDSIRIGDNTHIQRNCILACWKEHNGKKYDPSIEIGNNCNIGDNTQLSAICRIVVGNGVLMGRYVLITDNAHGGLSHEEASVSPSQRELKSKGEIVIGNNTWIGERAVILSGVHIGDNVIIGANSVVTKDIPNNCIVTGYSSRIIRNLDISK